jgi:hypothetical protein
MDMNAKQGTSLMDLGIGIFKFFCWLAFITDPLKSLQQLYAESWVC